MAKTNRERDAKAGGVRVGFFVPHGLFEDIEAFRKAVVRPTRKNPKRPMTLTDFFLEAAVRRLSGGGADGQQAA